MDWRLLVKEHIAGFGIPPDMFALFPFQWFLKKLHFFCFFVLANQPTMNSGGVSRGRVCGCGCGCWRLWQVTSDRWHVTRDTWHLIWDTWQITLFVLFFFLSFSLYVRFGIGATIRTLRDIQRLRYAGYFLLVEWLSTDTGYNSLDTGTSKASRGLQPHPR